MTKKSEKFMVGSIGTSVGFGAGSRMVGIPRASSCATRGVLGSRVVATRGRKCGLLCSASLMARYQYARKADAMAKGGYKVRDFGHRAIGEGCSGPDVLALQEWLAESGYYNPSDGGFNGYFGSVTKEALQMWQRDVGVQVSGCFDSASKMAYLEHVRRSRGSENGGVDGNMWSYEKGVVKESAHPLRKANVAQIVSNVLPQNQEWRVGTEAAYVAVGMLGLVCWLALSKGKGIFVYFDRVKRAIGGSFVILGSQRRIQSSKPVQMTREQDESSKRATVPEKRRYRKSSSSTPRLTREELNKFLAPMKGVQQSRRRRATGPAPYRDDGRITSVFADKNKENNTRLPDVQRGIVTRHGVYFAPPKKDVMAAQKQARSTGLESSRMESIGYNMNGSMDDGSRRHQLSKYESQMKHSRREPAATFVSKPTGGEISPGARSTQYPVQPTEQRQDGSLLDGTELEPMRQGEVDRQIRTESVPSKQNFPVPVVRPGDNDAKVSVMGKGQASEAISDSIQNNSNTTTVILHDKPVKLHKPSRLVKEE